MSASSSRHWYAIGLAAVIATVTKAMLIIGAGAPTKTKHAHRAIVAYSLP